MSALYPEITPFETGHLPVSEGHSLYFERSGTQGARAVLFLHGGPGSGSGPRHRRYYDPARFEIVQFDQRGCGKSTPHVSLEANTTAHQIEDIEALRRHLGLERWIVFGPSWGATLAIAYAEAYPDAVEALVVEGVLLGTREECSWWHRPDGAGLIHPDARDWLMRDAPRSVQHDAFAFMDWALEAMRAELAEGAPRLNGLADPQAGPGDVEASLIYRWSAFEEILSWRRMSRADVFKAFKAKGRDWLIAHSLIEAHYFSNACFLDGDALIEGAGRLTMPVEILQTRYDLVCPAQAAWRLHRAVPHSTLQIVTPGGHAMSEPMFKRVREVFDRLAASPAG